MFSFYTIINNCVYDVIKGFEISHKIIQLKKIETQDLSQLIEELKEINIMNINKSKVHYNFIIIINVINIILLICLILIYTNFISLENFTFILLYLYYSFVLLSLFIIMIAINFFKKQIINNNYYNQDKFAMNLFNINSKQLIYYLDILIYKISIDLFLNIPLVIYISYQRLTKFGIVLYEFNLFIFIFIGSNFLFCIDNNSIKCNNIIASSNILRVLFCFDSKVEEVKCVYLY
jgi:hypothetical protein